MFRNKNKYCKRKKAEIGTTEVTNSCIFCWLLYISMFCV